MKLILEVIRLSSWPRNKLKKIVHWENRSGSYGSQGRGRVGRFLVRTQLDILPDLRAQLYYEVPGNLKVDIKMKTQ